MAKKILIIGDTILDETVDTTAIGLSLETPTLKVSHDSTTVDLGGAANVAKNLVNLGCDVTFVTSGVVDVTGANVISLSGSPHKKTRVWVSRGDGNYKYLQINQKETARVETDVEVMQLLDQEHDTLVISDYSKGTLTPSLIRLLIKYTNFSEIISMAQISDKEYDYSIFNGSNFLVLNEREWENQAANLTGISCVVTRGENGALFISDDNYFEEAGVKVDAVDTTGAGDCFVAAFCAADGDVRDRIKAANEYAAKSTLVFGTKIP
jgi:D-beta-D-heptose 7-phosphate kinase/D-beta-D-heptose 1-phosphate adenosyltransferase